MEKANKNQEFGSRLRSCLEERGLSNRDFAEKASLKPNTLSNYLNNVSKPNFETLVAFTKILGVSSDYLLGIATDGNPNGNVDGNLTPANKSKGTKNPEEATAPHLIATRTEIILTTPDVGSNRTVPIVNRKAAASYLAGYQTQEYYEELEAMTVPSYMLRGGAQGLIIQAVNDSMEDTIFEGDYLLCRYIERGQWLEINDFTVCVVVTESRGIQVKRVKNRLRSDGLLRMTSDNRRHPSFNVFLDDIHQIWQVAFLLTANLPNRAETLYRKLDTLEDTTTDLREMYEQMLMRQEEWEKHFIITPHHGSKHVKNGD